MNEFEIVELAGRETRKFWVIHLRTDKIVGKTPTHEMAIHLARTVIARENFEAFIKKSNGRAA